MGRTLITTLVLVAVWLLWSGHTEPLLLAFGLASVLAVVAISHRMDRFSGTDRNEYPGFGFLAYLPWLVWQIFKSNIDVARIILSPALPISPRLVQVSTTQRTELGKVIHANSITLTPGTISLDLRDDQILVHALTAESAQGVESAEIDRRVSRIERAR